MPYLRVACNPLPHSFLGICSGAKKESQACAGSGVVASRNSVA